MTFIAACNGNKKKSLLLCLLFVQRFIIKYSEEKGLVERQISLTNRFSNESEGQSCTFGDIAMWEKIESI